MASTAKFSYQRLRNEGGVDEEAEEIRAFRRKRKWSRFRKRKRLKVRIPGLRRFLRKRAKFFCTVKVSWGKALKRLKNGQAYMSDLFGGNYLLMQGNLTLFKCAERPFMAHGLPSGYYSLGRIA